MLRVAQIFIIEEAKRAGGDDRIARLFLRKQTVGHKAAGVGAHGDVVLAAQGLLRGGAERIRARDEAAVQRELERDVLSGAEVGQRRAVGTLEDEGLGLGLAAVDDAVDDQLEEVRMQGLRVLIDREHAADLIGGSGLDGLLADLLHVLEFEHVELADQSDFHFQIRHYFFPPSLQALRSLKALPAISWPQTMVAE